MCDDRDDVTWKTEEVRGDLEVAQAELGSREDVAQEQSQLHQGPRRQQPPPEAVPDDEQHVSEEVEGGDRDQPLGVTGCDGPELRIGEQQMGLSGDRGGMGYQRRDLRALSHIIAPPKTAAAATATTGTVRSP